MKKITRAEAKQLGLKTYYTGTPCKHGHISERRTYKGICVECSNKYKRDKYWTETKEYQNRKSAGWKAANKEKVAAYNKEWRQKHKEYFSAWKKNNKDSVNASTYKRRTAKMYRMPVWVGTEELWLIKEAYALSSLRTKMFGTQWHVDHIVPLQGKSVSGLHVIENLQVIPGIENCKKANRYTV